MIYYNFVGILFISVLSLTGAYSKDIQSTHTQLTYQDIFKRSFNSVVKVIDVLSNGGSYSGTGFRITTPKGAEVILTNAHICEKKGNLVITFNHGMPPQDTTILKIGQDASDNDLCVISYTDKAGYFTIPLELNDQTVDVGQTVYVIGHPLGMMLTPSDGVIVSPLSSIHNWSGLFIYTTNIVYQGNSGSPLLDTSNHVVGIVNAENPIGRGDVIPVAKIKEFIKDL